ncbi:MAG TPA: hypothetical protein VJ907_01505 [Halanaerobiales bacterium]|nr:hypothetical protein [Halanaerobiales bacterium]
MNKKIFSGKFKVVLIAFLIILLSGFILNLISQGNIKVLYWMVIPSIIFEELIESSFPIIADNEIITLTFIFIFWYLVVYIILNFYVILKIINNEESQGRNN